MFKELFLSAVISASAIIKSSNDNTKAHDYEYMFKLEKNEENISYLIERVWERELGNKFIDNIFHFNYVTPRKIYYGIDVIDKESKEIDYKTLNIGYKYDFGMQCGISIKEENEITYLANLSYNKKIISNMSEYLILLSVKSDLEDDNMYDVKAEFKKWLSERVNIFLLYKHIYINKKEDYQFKIGLGFKL